MSQHADSAPTYVDKDGNTALHRAAINLHGTDKLDELVAAGADVNQTNKAGQTPLHVLCGHGWYDVWLDPDLVEQTEWFLQHTDNVDAPDALHAVRPLHIASMMYEYLTKALLAAGADPAGATSEGLTPLHLAARARQSNVVGMLLDKLQATGKDTVAYSNVINAKDASGWTPLHHACRSGRHETVALLLEAGLDVSAQDNEGRTVLDACMDFEDEQLLWDTARTPDKDDWELTALVSIPPGWRDVAVGGTGLHDTLRPWVAPGRIMTEWFEGKGYFGDANGCIRSSRDTTRLGEILRMLYQKQAADSRTKKAFITDLDRCIQHLGAKGETHGYTLRCFKDLSAELKGQKWTDSQQDAEIIRALPCKGAVTYKEEACVDETIFGQLLRRREYGVIERLLRGPRPGCDTPRRVSKVGSLLRMFVEHGYANLVAVLLDANQDIAVDLLRNNKLYKQPVDAILFVACKRELPNMDVVRVLVESGHVDINGQSRTTAEILDADHSFFPVGNDPPDTGRFTALHELAAGRHWWGVARGIPYLLAKGADSKVVNEDGRTPLVLAREYQPREIFITETEELLEKCL